MQTPDDEQFEMYLKRFVPIAPDRIPTLKMDSSFRPPFVLGVGLAAFAAILLVGIILVVHIRSGSRVAVPNMFRDAASAEQHVPLEPLTTRSANAWLTAAPSFKTAIDDLAFRSQSNAIPQDKQSAVALLNKEKIKL